MRPILALALALVACHKADPEPDLAEPVLPQAIGGAFFANPDVHPQIPVRVVVDGTVDEVEVAGPGGIAEAFEGADGVWVAWLQTGTADGTVTATVRGPDGERAASAELVVGTEGVQLTDRTAVGTATTPALHRDGDRLWASWCDKSEATSQCWLRELDGAARWQGDAVRLTDPGDDVLYGRTALGDGQVGLLYQLPDGLPYSARFRVVGVDGAEVLAPVTLHEDGWDGTFGQQVAFDGEAFAMVWRERSTTTADSRIRWMRVAADGTTTGPVTITASGDGAPVGGFDTYTFVELAVFEGATLVTWVQYEYNSLLDVDLPKAQFAVVAADGELLDKGFLGDRQGFDWDLEAHAGTADGELVALWTADDLGSPENVIPTEIRARSFAANGDPIALPSSVEQAPDTRGEPALFDPPTHRAAMAWIDHRTYTEAGLDSGAIQLHVASLSDNLQARPAYVYPHARFFAGLTELGGALADTNLLLTWRDQRHDNVISEMWFETAWVAP